MRIIAALTCLISTTAVPCLSAAELLYPVIQGHGGIVVVPGGVQKPKNGTKFAIDITTGKNSGNVHRGLDKAARYVNLYGYYGLRAGKDYEIVLVLHGDATAIAVDEPQATKGNANRKLIRQLKKAGVEIFVCGQSLAHKKLKFKQVISEVRIAVSAANVLINKQSEGFAYLPIH